MQDWTERNNDARFGAIGSVSIALHAYCEFPAASAGRCDAEPQIIRS